MKSQKWDLSGIPVQISLDDVVELCTRDPAALGIEVDLTQCCRPCVLLDLALQEGNKHWINKRSQDKLHSLSKLLLWSRNGQSTSQGGEATGEVS